MKMGFAAVLVNTDHAVLENGEHVLNHVGVDNDVAFLPGLFFDRMLNGAVLGVFGAGDGVEVRLVSHEG